jgi:prepilin-type N-terminal cleavage/methylation domain-containing protein
LRVRTGNRVQSSGFTLLELATVLLVIGILVVMLIPGFSSMKSRAERSVCSNNLANLYFGANSFVQEQGHWPQIPTKLQSPAYAKNWLDALSPYGLSKKNWICPSVQRQLHDPDYLKEGSTRIDYFATPFDESHLSPYKWPTQPWFVERGNVHGDGNLVIFTNGKTQSLSEITRDPRFKVYNP